MEIKLNVHAKSIAVLKLFASDKDDRYNLKGIALEIGATESRLVATNGSMLGCIRIVSEQPEVTAPMTNIIIPNDLLKSIKPSGMVEIAIGDLETKDNEKGEQVPVSNSRPITLTYAGVSISGKTIDGVFPEFRHVFPSKVSGQPAQFDLRLIGTLAKVWSIIHGGKGPHLVRIGFNGTDAALIDLAYEDFIGAIMPLRSNTITVPVAAPPWCADSLLVATSTSNA